MQVDHVDISELPLLNTDLEDGGGGGGGFPPAVEAFRAKVRAADCFLFASPEYNYSISGIPPDYYTLLLPLRWPLEA
jgi:NAD(P)H-dependent FMN reductase